MLIHRPDPLPEEKLAFVVAYCDNERNLALTCQALDIDIERGKEFLADHKVTKNILYEMNLRQTQGVSEENILRQVARMTFYDPRQLFDKNDELRPMHELPDELAAAIQGVKVTKRVLYEGIGPDRVQVGTEYNFDYKFCDRNSSVEKLMKFMGMFELDNRQRGDAVTEMLQQVYAKGKKLPLAERVERSLAGDKIVEDLPVREPEPEFEEPATFVAELPEPTYRNPYKRP